MGEKAVEFSKKHGFKLLETKNNSISMAMNLISGKKGSD